MTDLHKAAQQALEALEMSRRFVYADNRPQCDDAIDALRAALAQEQAGTWQDGVLEGQLRERERWLAQEQDEPVAHECSDPMCACRGGPCAACEEGQREKEIEDLRSSLDFYQRRCEALQSWQSKMRDPERTIVCDILANGFTLDPAFAGNRYTAPPQQPAPEPVAVQEQDIEDAIEAAYWHFDARKKGLNEWASAPQSERDAFKAETRKLVKGYFPTRQAQDTKREMLAVADAFIRGKRAALAQEQAEPVAVSVDALAQHIRFVDGNNNLGAGILAEKIVEFLIKLGIGKEQAEPVQEPYTGDVTRIMREAGMTFHLGLPHKAVVEQMTRVVDLVYAEASIKAAQQFAIAPPKAEPVTRYSVDQPLNYMTRCADGTEFINTVVMPAHAVSWAYTAPPQRKPLTDEEIGRICDAHWCLRQLARAIERAHGIKERK